MLYQFPLDSPAICSHLDLLRPSLQGFVGFVCRSFSSNLTGRQVTGFSVMPRGMVTFFVSRFCQVEMKYE